jgi:hypothetical protein
MLNVPYKKYKVSSSIACSIICSRLESYIEKDNISMRYKLYSGIVSKHNFTIEPASFCYKPISPVLKGNVIDQNDHTDIIAWYSLNIFALGWGILSCIIMMFSLGLGIFQMIAYGTIQEAVVIGFIFFFIFLLGIIAIIESKVKDMRAVIMHISR